MDGPFGHWRGGGGNKLLVVQVLDLISCRVQVRERVRTGLAAVVRRRYGTAAVSMAWKEGRLMTGDQPSDPSSLATCAAVRQKESVCQEISGVAT